MSRLRAPYRKLYSTLNEVPSKTLVPENPYRRTEGAVSFRKSRNNIPGPNQILHPFYSPTELERAALCITEVSPKLLNGKPVIPAIIEHPRTMKPVLLNTRLQFDTVKEVYAWVRDFVQNRTDLSKLDLIDIHEINSILRSSKLDKRQLPQIIKLASLFSGNDVKETVSKPLNLVIDSLAADKDMVLFSEDIFLYLLQHHADSDVKVISIIESIITFLNRDIDQFKVAETLVLQVLVSMKNNQIKVTPSLTSAFVNLINAISDRFHHQNCITCFQPVVSCYVLDFYLQSAKLNESKIIFTDLINKKLCPRGEIISQYLDLIESELGSSYTDEELLRKFVYISDFASIFQTVLTPKIVEYLLPYCRHFHEVTSLLTLIENSNMKKQILDVNLPQLIRKASNMTTNNIKNSINLSALYQRVSNHYGGKIPDKIKKSFILQYAFNQNYTMIVTLTNELEEGVSPNFYARIMTMVEEWHHKNLIPRSNTTPGFSILHKRQYLASLVLPHYSKMSAAGKLVLINHLDCTELASSSLKLELGLFQQKKKSILPEVLVAIYKHGLVFVVSPVVKELLTSEDGIAILKHACSLYEPFKSIVKKVLGDDGPIKGLI